MVKVVGSVASGEEAIAAVPVLKPDMVLMDFDMPGMNGIEATRRIKQAYANVRVVIVTLHDWAWNRQAAIASGADSFISKASFSKDCRMLLAGWYRLVSETARREPPAP